MLTGPYRKLYRSLSSFIPRERLIHDDLRLLAYGTDASFYRLIPKLIIKVESEEEVIQILKKARQFRTPLAFRAAGTSLSGQSITDSVLVVLGSQWNKVKISPDASTVTLQPGVIGAHANRCLQPFGRKIGPDPASINSAMIGGIAANNASGMCCGTAQNSYQTLSAMRMILSDGSILDTQDPESKKSFFKTHSEMISRIHSLSFKTKQDPVLSERIRRKYKMKNTTGYSLNALVDFRDPLDMIQHLMIGSEGTLGFISEITLRTVPDPSFKATSLMLFPDMEIACRAVGKLASLPISAVELMDRASLRSVEHKEGMPEALKGLGENVVALLVEARSDAEEALAKSVGSVMQSIVSLPKVEPVTFSFAKAEQDQLWNIRKGLFPSVGAMREAGTTVIIEDVCFPVERLAHAACDLQRLFEKHGYPQAILFGHALEGNLHFVFKQDFKPAAEVTRYKNFMDDLTHLVVEGYDGSLKAEHGTGRNMAPFVEMEWGREAYGLMKEIKAIFDPDHLINPGVILNNDPQIHLKNLKPLPRAHSLIDPCIECGFCEIHCPSRNLTLTPRQRIVVFREMARLAETRENPGRLARLRKDFRYQGEKTCAADGMCSINCPVDIDTGKLIKVLRYEQHSQLADRIATSIAENMGKITAAIRGILNITDFFHSVLGSQGMEKLTSLLRLLSGNKLPQWNRYIPKGAGWMIAQSMDESNPLKVVYFPSCIARTFGVSRQSLDPQGQIEKTDSLLHKAGYEAIYPQGLSGLCCGLVFASKGFTKQGEKKRGELEEALRKSTAQGKYPVLFDTSPCLYQMREGHSSRDGLRFYDPIEFAETFLVKRLTFRKLSETIGIHATCSTQKMGLDSKLKGLAEKCAEHVVSSEVSCCGFAGDKGLTTPELTASALGSFKDSLPKNCRRGYSTSLTCEIGLSLHSGIPHQSIFYLLDRCTEPNTNVHP